MKREGTVEAKSKYKLLVKKVKKACRKARIKHERRLSKTRKNNPKAFYSYVSSRTKIKAAIGPLVCETDGKKTEIVDDLQMATELNRYFASVHEKSAGDIPLPNITRLAPDRCFELVTFDREKIEKAIDSLKGDTAPGPDGIGAKTLKNLKKVRSRLS